MIILNGKYNSAKVYTDIIDESAIAQIIELLNQPMSEGQLIRIMPDVHAGAGCTIGTTMSIKDKVVPNLVGVDIGCFTGSTKVRLADGRAISFTDLIAEHKQGIEHYGYCIDKNNHIKIGKLEYPRLIKYVNKLVKLTLDNNEVILCTTDHLIMRRDGEYVEAEKLKVGDSLMPLYTINSSELEDNYFKNRWLDAASGYTCVYDPKTNKYVFAHFFGG